MKGDLKMARKMGRAYRRNEMQMIDDYRAATPVDDFTGPLVLFAASLVACTATVFLLVKLVKMCWL